VNRRVGIAAERDPLRRWMLSDAVDMIFAILAGDSSRTTVAAEIVRSREGAQVTVNDFYFRFLRRAPDPVGFKASVSALQQGVIAELLIMTIVGSDEYFNAL
jgi:hypothetical protein